MITKAYQEFFKGLEKNNNKTWFHEHKKQYINDVKEPFLNLLEKLIPELETLEPRISMFPKDALFRINRDIRFSKDKTPYNVLMKAGFSPGGKKSLLPGFYLGISADTIHVGGGLFNLKSPGLKSVRELILQDTKKFKNIVETKAFVSMYKELKGERAKRLDKKFQPILESTPYIANKQFYAMQDLPLEEYLDAKKIHKALVQAFRTIQPLNAFLMQADLE